MQRTASQIFSADGECYGTLTKCDNEGNFSFIENCGESAYFGCLKTRGPESIEPRI